LGLIIVLKEEGLKNHSFFFVILELMLDFRVELGANCWFPFSILSALSLKTLQAVVFNERIKIHVLINL
jgi:hypothetical protein